MLKRYKSFLSLLLVLCMLMQPFAAPMTVWAEEAANESTASIEDSESSFDEAYDKVMALEEIEIGWFMKQILNCCSAAENCGEWYNSAVNGTEPKYVDYVAQIKESNAAVEQAQKDMEAAKKSRDSNWIKAAAKLDPKEIEEKGLAAASHAQAVNQDCLEKAGNLLVDLGNTFETIKTVVEVISPIMKIVACIPIPAVQEIALAISEICDGVTLALDAAIPIFKGAGQGLLDTAAAAYASDAQLIGNIAKNTAGEAGKIVAEEAISAAGSALLGDSAKWFADSGLTNTGKMTAFWDASSLGKSAASEYTFDLLSQMNSTVFNEATKEATKEATEGLIDLGFEAADMSLPTVKGFVNDKTNEGIDYIVDQSVNKPAKSSSGLDFE